MHLVRERDYPKRLEAVPWTRHCIACQENLEKGRDCHWFTQVKCPESRTAEVGRLAHGNLIMINAAGMLILCWRRLQLAYHQNTRRADT